MLNFYLFSRHLLFLYTLPPFFLRSTRLTTFRQPLLLLFLLFLLFLLMHPLHLLL
jgi:hypothetical protein